MMIARINALNIVGAVADVNCAVDWDWGFEEDDVLGGNAWQNW